MTIKDSILPQLNSTQFWTKTWDYWEIASEVNPYITTFFLPILSHPLSFVCRVLNDMTTLLLYHDTDHIQHRNTIHLSKNIHLVFNVWWSRWLICQSDLNSYCEAGGEILCLIFRTYDYNLSQYWSAYRNGLHAWQCVMKLTKRNNASSFF